VKPLALIEVAVKRPMFSCQRRSRTAPLLPTGFRALRFMDEQLPGIAVPTATIARLQGAADCANAAYELALEQARHALSLPRVGGVHLIDFRRDGTLSRLCTNLGISPRTEREGHAHRTAVTV
jgi:methylenetetrahydrofolate reductase (NADH)